MILHRLNQLLSSRDPRIVRIRELIWGNDVLRGAARLGVRIVRLALGAPHEIRMLLRSKEHAKLTALAEARLAGGSLSLEDLEAVWSLDRFRGQALLDAEAPERAQIAAILHALGVAIFSWEHVTSGARPKNLFVITTGRDDDASLVARLGIAEPKGILRVGNGSRSVYSAVEPAREPEPGQLSLAEKLARDQRIHVVLLNDIGFLYGAGTALKRQALSFLLKGWDVTSLGWTIDSNARAPRITGLDRSANWKGFRRLHRTYPKGGSDDLMIADILLTLRELRPDVVVTGNLHGVPYPLQLLTHIRKLGIPVMTYMHDVYLLTGRCAQPLDCGKFRTGCDAACPTFDEHPSLPREKIAAAWQKRADVFTGPERVPLIANSHWTQGMVVERFGEAATHDMVHLALDHEAFAPLPRAMARRLVGINDERPLVIMGAADMNDKWKGGPLFREVYDALKDRKDVGVLLFGRASESLASVKSFGLVDEGVLPFILNAADIFVSTTIADSFGQTLLEASACALPVVVPDVGGVKDVVIDGETGRVTGAPTAASLLEAINQLVADEGLRRRLGENGRRRVEEHYTLTRQADAWVESLKRLAAPAEA
jgi:glycosyltransferase involved in cell wall biosynthesis